MLQEQLNSTQVDMAVDFTVTKYEIQTRVDFRVDLAVSSGAVTQELT